MRRRITTISAALVALALAAGGVAWATGPALSGGRYIPDPVEFEAAVPGIPGGGARAAGRRVTRIVRPGKRFNLFGLRWRGGDVGTLRARVRRGGGDWSRWVPVGTDPGHAPDRGTGEHRRAVRASDPVWAGQADVVQLAFSGARRPRAMRLRFLNTTGTATPIARLRTRLRGLAAGAVAMVRGLAGASAARADTSQPAIVGRDQWAGSRCAPRADPDYGEVKLAFVHHTVSANTYGPEDSAAMVLGICRYHRDTNGWNDIGYNFVVDRYGTIFEGRGGGVGEAVIGAQAQGYNASSTGVASLGTFSSGGQTPAGLGAIARLLSWKLAVHGVPPTGKVDVVSAGGSTNRFPAGSRPDFDRISGHRDGNATACPGDGLYAQLPQLRAMVDPGPPRAATRTTAERERRNITYGGKAALRLSVGVGGTPPGNPVTPLGGRRVDVQVLGRLGWRTNHSVVTDASGRAATRMRLSLNRRLRARFTGEPGLLPSSSASLAVGVRPAVTAAASVTGRRVGVTGTVRPRKRTAILTVKRRTSRGSLVRVSRRTVKLRRGRLATTLRVTRPGAYRLRLSTLADTRNLSARSPVVEFRVG